ncbi:uncharacterized protein [Physcomitrium patens]|uniref:HMA domain-containing protein n=1 Tax=Physcomitrium patens TaxID=3218 RepID=A0A2K1KL03_PHYPA|nr:heavy metal-associated isoprenylated plant protein 39-like [Physcomitrium patens]PNR54462.1 hypothetical protein PHYPA_008139 [Physcomitrium patens]|eukprot:XP_024374914.1 heavy metal-associated isoprenylated plant protein 39-like [Physcomitrella patens]
MAETEICYSGGPQPPWLDKNAWYIPVQVPKEHADRMPRIALHKVELKVHMCCPKCAEIVAEEIRYLGGVFNVEVDQKNSKVTVTGRPDPERVLKRARKVDRHATFWPTPPPQVVQVVEEVVVEKPKEDEKKEDPKTEEKKEEVKAEGKKEDSKEEKVEVKEEKKEEKKEESSTPVVTQVQYPPPYSTYGTAYGYPPYGFDYRPSQSYTPLYPDYHMGYGPQIPLYNPNYMKHVKIAY